MGLLVPVLAGLDIDEIIGYVNDLTNLDIAIDPQTFANSAKFGSELKNFIGNAETWADVEAKYEEYVYTYETGETDDEGKPVTETITSDDANLDGTDYTVGEGEDAKTYTLTKKTEEVETTNADGTVTKTTVHVKQFVADYDWKIESLDDVVNLACDILRPLDAVLELLLVGESLIVIEDPDVAEGEEADQIEIVGGRGYNYAIIPLLEALGVEALSEADYIAAAENDGHLKPILTALIAKVETLLAAPISTLLPMLANIFYFVGTDGINNIASNLLAFANYLLLKVDPVFHIGVKVDVSAEKIFEYELGDEEGKDVPAGVNINVNPDDLIALVNDLLAGLKVVDIDGDGEKDPLGLSLDIDWLDIAAKMAATDADGIIEIPTAQVKNDGSAATWYNIIGDAEDTFTTLINTILTEENT